MSAQSGTARGLLSPGTLLDGRDAVRSARRLALIVLSTSLSVYLWIVIQLSRHWSLTALIAALAVIPIAGVLGTVARGWLVARKIRQLQLLCRACAAPLIDVRGEMTIRDASCAGCGQVVLAAEEHAAPAADQLPTQREFAIRVDEWFIALGDDNDAFQLVGGIAFVLIVAWLLAQSILPEWTALIAVAVIAIPLIMVALREGQRRRRAERLGLYCACGVLLVEPGGPELRRGVKAAMGDIDRSRKTGTCWRCGRRVWRPESIS